MNKKIFFTLTSFFFLFFLIKNSFAAGTQTTVFNDPVLISTVKEFLLSMIGSLRMVLISIAILFIIIGGMFYLAAGESSERIGTAKKIWVGSIIGLMIALLAPTFLRAIQDNFLIGGQIPTNLNEVPSLTTIVTNVINTLLSIVGILTIISLVISGFIYIFSFGDSSRAEKAKEMIKWSIVGMALAGASVIIVRQIANLILPPG